VRRAPIRALSTASSGSLAAARCAWEFRCCTDAEIGQQEGGKYTDEATCELYQQLALESTMYADRVAVRESRSAVDGAQAALCVAAQMTKACNAASGSTSPSRPPPGTVDPCSLVFKGATAVGDECGFATECVRGGRCVAAGSAQGVCVPFQEEAQLCNASADCDPSVAGLYCAELDFTCRVRSTVGGPCAYRIDPVTNLASTPLFLECDTSSADLFCDPTSRTCRALPQSGDPCLSPPLPPGIGSACAPGLLCDMPGATGGICRGPGNVGDDCTRIPCEASLYCDRSVTPNRCSALPTAGQPCQQSSFRCAAPSYCNVSVSPYVCATPAQLGQPCSGSVLCDTSLYCDSTGATASTCQARLPDGWTCTQNGMCLSSDCSSGMCVPSPVSVLCIGRP
jgi:hypothetical protein